MDEIAGDGWEKLCPFLEKPIPSNKFPHANKGKDHYTLLEKMYDRLRSAIPTEIRRKILDILGIPDRRNRFNNFRENQKYI